MTDPDPDHALGLDRRTGLPDALRVLLQDYPREGWPLDRNFDGLVSFWLDRHMMFRRLMEVMQTDTRALLEGDSDPDRFATRLSRFGGQFVNELHGHHQIEDAHYFPVFARQEPRIEAGFALLDADHHALDGHLNRFVLAANGLLNQRGDRHVVQTAAGRFLDDLTTLEGLLNRHLIDEEELVVPVVLRHGAGGLG